MEQIKKTYHRLLQADPAAAQRSLSFLYEEISDKVVYKGKPVPLVVEPGFISLKRLDLYTAMLVEVQHVLEKVIDIALDKYVPKNEKQALCEEVKQVFNLNERELALMGTDCGVSSHVLIYRLDLYANGYPYILEFNCDSAGGILEVHEAAEVFLTLPQIKKLEEEGFTFLPDTGPEMILKALLKSQYQRKGKVEHPTILITDWRDVGTKVEQERLRDFFQAKGYPTFLADPRELTFKKGMLYYNNELIDIVHRRVIVKELAARFSEIQPLLEAARSGAASLINPFSSALGSNKAILAIISDPQYHPLFNPDDISQINKFLPWTRMFNFKADPSLIEKVRQNKDGYVLKQCKSYGGEAVLVGRAKDREEWMRKLDAILQSTEELWIVQEYVDRQFEVFPFIEDNKVVLKKMVLNVNPYIIESEYACGIIRLSPPEAFVINVAQGGAQIPMIRYTKKG